MYNKPSLSITGSRRGTLLFVNYGNDILDFNKRLCFHEFKSKIVLKNAVILLCTKTLGKHAFKTDFFISDSFHSLQILMFLMMRHITTLFDG